MKLDIKEKYRRFRAWQESPFSYAMDGEEKHLCHNCGREFAGNFCPQCGQKATQGKVNWASVREGVMEIWGVGTRSMPYTLWQLLWRPGYLIRDYISGRRQVSFPPVKMLLIVGIICMIMLELINPEATRQVESKDGWELLTAFYNWSGRNRGWSILVIYSMMILPTWVLFRHSPRLSAHSLPQGFFIQVFLSTLALMISDVAIVLPVASALIPLYFFIAYYQLFGYGLWGTLWRIVTCFVAMSLTAVIIIFLSTSLKKGDAADASGLSTEMSIAIFSLLFCIAILALGYAIGWWTKRRRERRSAAVAAAVICGVAMCFCSCKGVGEGLPHVAGTLDEPIGESTAPARVLEAIDKCERFHRWEIMSDTVSDVAVFGISEADTTSTEGYGIMVMKGRVSTTFPHIRNVRQPKAVYDSQTDVLWFAASAMEGTGVAVERLYKIRFNENDSAYVVTSVEPYDIQQYFCQQLTYSIDGEQISIYDGNGLMHTITNTITDMGPFDEPTLWIGEQIQYDLSEPRPHILITPGVKFTTGLVLLYDNMPTLRAPLTVLDDDQ